MAAKDADLARGPIAGTPLFLVEVDVAAFEIELTDTPPMPDEAGRRQDAYLTTTDTLAKFEIEFTDLPSGGIVIVPVFPGDQLPPEISNFTAPGALESTNTPIEFDIKDIDPGIGLVLVSIQYADTPEPVVIYSGDQFEGAYAAQSTKVPILLGFRFTLLRDGGWPDNITNVWVYSVDQAGEVGDLP